MPTRNQFSTVAEYREAIRVWFAGQALMGILACPIDHKGDKDQDSRAETAWSYADSMMGGIA
jgi:hypothetical protein